MPNVIVSSRRSNDARDLFLYGLDKDASADTLRQIEEQISSTDEYDRADEGAEVGDLVRRSSVLTFRTLDQSRAARR